LQEAYKEFMKKLSVSQDKKTGFVHITFEHYSPRMARQWVNWIVKDLNAAIMKQDVDEAERAIVYLNKQIRATPLAGLKDVFFNLIEEQTKTIMLAKVSQEYMFRTVDPAVAPERKFKPRRPLIVVLGLLLGGMTGAVTVLLLNGIPSYRAWVEHEAKR